MMSLERLQQIIPADQALANKALAISLQQIAGTTNMNLSTLANAVIQMETTRDLPEIMALTEAVPASVANYYINTLGNNGQPLVVCDVLGIAAGYKVTDIFNNTVSTLANTNVSYLTSIYNTMSNVVIGTYGDPTLGPIVIPSGSPAAGTYYAETAEEVNPDPPPANITVVVQTAAESAFTGTGTGNATPTGPGLIPVADIEIANILSNSPSQVSVLNSNFTSLAAQVTTEKNLQATIQIDFANLTPNSSASIYSLITSLPYYGQQDEQGGLFQFWEGVANLSSFTGQAMIAAMREGHNQQYLDGAGIQTNNHIPSDPVPPIPTANLIPSTYSAQEAANLVIK